MSSHPGSTRAAVVFHDLGDLLVEVHGRQRTAGGARPSALLAALLVHANRRVSVDVLTAAVWPDGPPRTTSTLESHLWRLRQVLEPDRAPGEASRLVRTEVGGYRLVVDDEQVDSLRFARLVREAGDRFAQGHPDAVVRSCDEAREIWRGRPFAAVADQSWAAPAVARLEELHSQLREHHIGALLELGRTEVALVEIGTALGEHPLRERLWNQRMTASYRAGRVDDALSAYAEVRMLLRDELGTDPGEELRETHRRVLAGDPVLRGPARPSAPVDLLDDPDLPRLPRWTTRTIGREHELERLGGLLADARLVTVSGPAGVGKTRLAVEAARRVAPSFPDGVCFVDLTGAGDGDQVVVAIASGLGLSASPSGSQADALRTFLRRRRVLLLLDDCEHVVDEVAGLAVALGSEAPQLSLLVTSRERLELDSETVVELAPLSVPDTDRPHGAALELFLDRWEAVVGPTAPDDLEHARRVCHAVEGIPLALELAAARARTFSLEEVADQSEQDPSTLSGLGRRRRGRRSSVYVAVERTHRLLDEDEQRMHRALAVVPGAFTLRAAAALAGSDTARAADLLADLAHRSLLTTRATRDAGRPTSFAQLTIVRAHGARALDQAGESDATRDRRDSWILRMVAERPRLGTTEEKVWSDALADDLAALRATLHRCLVERPSLLGVAVVAGLGTMFWYQHDATAEGRRWIELASESARTGSWEVPSPVAVRIAIALATVRAFARRVDLAGPVCDRLLEDLEPEGAALGDPLAGDALVVLSMCLGLAGDQDRARRVLDLVGRMVGRSGDPTLDLLHRVRASMSELGLGDPEVVLRRAAAVHDEARTVDNRFATWIASGVAHLAALAAGDGDAALGWSDACLAAVDRSGRRHAPFQLELRANTLVVLGRLDEARPLYDAARAHVERAGLPWPSMPGTADLLRRTQTARAGAPHARVGDDVARLTVRDLLQTLQRE